MLNRTWWSDTGPQEQATATWDTFSGDFVRRTGKLFQSGCDSLENWNSVFYEEKKSMKGIRLEGKKFRFFYFNNTDLVK